MSFLRYKSMGGQAVAAGNDDPERVAEQGPVCQAAVCGGVNRVDLDHGNIEHAAAE